jgi:hypothetical protein
MSTYPLAKASAYLRVNHRTKHAEVVHGAQVNFVLTEVYEDQQVRQQPGGGFVVTADDWTVIQYTPLAPEQDLRQLADSYKHWTAPGNGQKFHEQPHMEGKALQVLLRRQPGTFHVTRLGEIAHLYGGRIRNQYKPLTAADMATAA